MLFNEIYEFADNCNKNWEGFWNELNLNYSKINEEKDFNTKFIFPLLKNLSNNDLKDILSILKLEVTGEKEELIARIMAHEESKVLIYLDIFSKRKKRAIELYYDYKLYNEKEVYSKSSILVKLFHLFRLCHTYMFEMYVLEEWQSKGTGSEFKSSSDLQNDIISNMLKKDKQDKLCMMLSQAPKISTKYRVRMYCTIGKDQGVFMIYKLKNDSQKPDFDESKRVKDIEKILFKIDIENSSVHIKCKTVIERNEIKRFFEEEYNCELIVYEEPIFTEYTPEEFKNTFKTLDVSNKEELNNFQVNKITFSGCLLNKTPELVLSTPKKDIWPSVVHAFNMKLIDINSLHSIKNLNITVNNITRSIRTLHLEDGNIIFKLDDKGLDKNTVEEIDKKFKAMFSIPLNIRVKNTLERGKADQIDLVLRSNLKTQLEESEEEALSNLVVDKIIYITNRKKYICTNTSCGAEIDYAGVEIKQCTECGNDELIVQIQEQINVNYKQIEYHILDALSSSLDIAKEAILISNPKKFNSEYYFHKFIYNDKEYQILITNRIIPRKILCTIEKQLIPTIIFYFGIDSDQADLMTPNTIEMMQFGLLYVNKNDNEKVKTIFNKLLENLNKRLHYQIINASLLANEALRKIICKPSEINKKYTSDDFEDDIYAILKDLVFQSEKWGSDQRGKPLPEGVLAFAYTKTEGGNKIEHRQTFSFDCKLTYTDSGYDLGREEERKALEYVETINSTMEIRRYCTSSQLSSHIFIGNKFKFKQIENMNTYFDEHLKLGYSTKVVFIQFEDLLKFHDWYRTNYENIQKNRDVFYENFHKLLITNQKIIDDKDFQYLIEELEECFSDEKTINISRIKNKIKK